MPALQENIAAAERIGDSEAAEWGRERLAAVESQLRKAYKALTETFESWDYKYAKFVADRVFEKRETYDALKEYTLREHNAAWLALSFVPALLLDDGVLTELARVQRRSS
jgi:hypothetical protein